MLREFTIISRNTRSDFNWPALLHWLCVVAIAVIVAVVCK